MNTLCQLVAYSISSFTFFMSFFAYSFLFDRLPSSLTDAAEWNFVILSDGASDLYLVTSVLLPYFREVIMPPGLYVFPSDIFELFEVRPIVLLIGNSDSDE